MFSKYPYAYITTVVVIALVSYIVVNKWRSINNTQISNMQFNTTIGKINV